MQEDLELPFHAQGEIWLHRSTGWSHVPHRHTELEFNLVTQGRATYLVGDRRIEMLPRHLLWLFPAQNHVLLDESADYEMWIAVFRPTLLHHVCTTSLSLPLCQERYAGPLCKRLTVESSARLAALLDEIRQVREDWAIFNAGLGYSVLWAWAAHQETEEFTVTADVHPAVERAARFLRDETEDVNLESVADIAGLSLSRLSELFRMQTGVSLGEFRNRQRVERFLRLYGNGQRMTLIQAALEAGFGSYPQFHRVFKQTMGCGPAQYRRGLRDTATPSLRSRPMPAPATTG